MTYHDNSLDYHRTTGYKPKYWSVPTNIHMGVGCLRAASGLGSSDRRHQTGERVYKTPRRPPASAATYPCGLLPTEEAESTSTATIALGERHVSHFFPKYISFEIRVEFFPTIDMPDAKIVTPALYHRDVCAVSNCILY